MSSESLDPDDRQSAADLPAIVAVDDDDRARGVLVGALRRRYGMDYHVVAAPGPQAGFDELVRLRADGAGVALIVASQWMASETGAAFLARTRSVCPTARRLLVTSFADFSAVEPVARAATLGEIDHYTSRPWNETDEQFFATTGAILAEWAREHGRYVPAMTIVGERWDSEAQTLHDTLQRWGTPIGFVEAGSPEGQRVLDEFGTDGPLPIVVLPDGRTLAWPSLSEVAEAFGANGPSPSTAFDVIVLGSGPAGLSAAVYGGSEGLRVLLVEPASLGGQASSSPMIRNYLGFPGGVSGSELLARAWQQAWTFGVQTLIGRAAQAIRSEGDELVVVLDDGSEARGKAIVLATGLAYRRIGIPSVDGLIGRGVFYGSGATEAQAMTGEPVAVVGGANSAAQAAVHLARYTRGVTVLVRGGSLGDGASDYLIRQLNDLGNVDVRLNAEVVEARDAQRLRSLLVRDNAVGTIAELEASALFIMIGAAPRTDWLPADIARDERGFVLTGDGAPRTGDRGVALPLESTVPGVFAVGDVRRGSTKRVATAVGEGATAIRQILTRGP